MRVGSCFSGIGGLDLGLERAGMEVSWQIERDEFCQKVLKHHWPGVPLFSDIKEVDYGRLDPVDLVVGGYPCQPFSLAGARRGEADDRHLWPHLRELVRVVQPRWLLLENVPGHLSLGFDEVLSDISQLGFDAEWDVLSARQFGAPHLRKRLWVVAYSNVEQRERREEDEHGARGIASPERHRGDAPNPSREQLEERGGLHRDSRQEQPAVAGGSPGPCITPDGVRWRGLGHWQAESPLLSVAHGIPDELAHLPAGRKRGVLTQSRARREMLKSCGNAVVPQIAEWIGRRILAAD